MPENNARTNASRLTWRVNSTDEGLRKLCVTMLANGKSDVDAAIAAYDMLANASKTFKDAVVNLRRTIEWLHAMHTEEAVMPFDDVCRAVGRNPDAIRKRMMEKVPKPLGELAFNRRDYTCPFCGSKG